jgi:hypothetical protein
MLNLKGTGKTLGTRNVDLYIYKVSGGYETEVGVEKFDVEPDWDYIYFDKFHTFYSAGYYKVTAKKRNGTSIATGYVTISMKSSYSGTKLYFCEEYSNGTETGVSDVFIIGTNGGYFTCMIDMRGTGRTIGVSSIKLKITKAGSTKVISNESWDIQSDWDYIFLDKFYVFYSAGDYTVTATTADGSYIASGDVTIKMKK